MLKTIISALMAVSIAAGISFSTAQPAAARNGAGVAAGVAAGIIGLGVLGAYAHARDRGPSYAPACYQGPRECRWTGRACNYDYYGQYVCRGGHYQCYRPTICP